MRGTMDWRGEEKYNNTGNDARKSIGRSRIMTQSAKKNEDLEVPSGGIGAFAMSEDGRIRTLRR